MGAATNSFSHWNSMTNGILEPELYKNVTLLNSVRYLAG